MNNLKDKINDILTRNFSSVNFATIAENGKPWVRYVSVKYDPKDMSIRFATFIAARKVKHVQKNPEVHLSCGDTDLGAKKGGFLQIQGLARCSQDKKERDAMWNDNMKAFFKGADDPDFVVVIVDPYLIEVNDLGNVFETKVWTKN